MFLVYLIKNICILSFYFSFISIIFSNIFHSPLFILYLVILLCFSLSYVFRFKLNNSWSKYIPILGFAGIMLYYRSIAGIAIVILPMVYMILFIIQDKYHVDYSEFKEMFFKLIFAVSIQLFFVLILRKVELFMDYSLQYVVVFFISGLYLMRTTRHSKEVITSKKFTIMNLSVIIITFILCIILSSNAILSTIAFTIKFIYNKLISPLILSILYIIFWPLMKIIAMCFQKQTDIKVVPMEVKPLPLNKPETINYDDSFSEMILTSLAVAFIVLLCIVIIVKIFNKAKRKRKIYDDMDGIKQYRTFIEDGAKSNKDTKNSANNSINQVRYWYKKFLLLCNKKRMDLLKCDTSQSIHDKSCSVFDNSPQELDHIKDIYRKARYSEEEIKSEDVKLIRSYYKNLESEQKNKEKQLNS